VSFGEIALLYNERRTATVVAVETCDTWVLEGKVFKNIIIKSALNRRNIELSFLDKVQIFCKFTNFNLHESLFNVKFN
jgi:CRP-like cAMP-binding protein